MTTNTSYEPTNLDVLLGRGGQTNNHVGNRVFRHEVQMHQNEYLSAKKKNKAAIARRIVDIIHERGGMFVAKNANGEWEQVPNKKAQEKTSQALREGLDVRRKQGKVSEDEPRAKRQKVSAVSFDDQEQAVPSLKEYDDGLKSRLSSALGESTTVPPLAQEEVLFHLAPPTREECNIIASV